MNKASIRLHSIFVAHAKHRGIFVRAKNRPGLTLGSLGPEQSKAINIRVKQHACLDTRSITPTVRAWPAALKRFGWFGLVFLILALAGLGPGGRAALAVDTYGDFTYLKGASNIVIFGYTGSGGAVTIPNTIEGLPVTAIFSNAFYNSANKAAITSIVLPSTVISIGDSAIRECTNLVSINLSNVTSIGAYAFDSCTKLANIDLLNVTSIGGEAFQGCSAITSVTLSSGITALPNQVFYGCTSLTTVSMPGVTSLGDNEFRECTNLTNIDLSKVTSIGAYAFLQCANLANIDLSKVTSIGEMAFSLCPNLTSVTLPANLTTINNYAFINCSQLAKVYFGGAVPATLGSSLFPSSTAIYCLKAYRESFASAFSGYTVKLYQLKVTYYGNSNTGGDVPTDAGSYEEGATATIRGNTGNLTRIYYTFNGWNTASDGTGSDYTVSQQPTLSDDLNLYVKWATVPPILSAVSPTVLKAGTTITATSDTGGTLYLVPQGSSYSTKADLDGATTKKTASATAGTAANLTTDGLTASVYNLYVVNAIGTLSEPVTITIDNTGPTATVTYSRNSVKAGDSLLITADFNEALLDSPAVRIAISGANTVAATNMTKVSATQYTYTYTVTGGDGTTTVAFSTGTDAAGNVVTATPAGGASFTVDNTGPTVSSVTATDGTYYIDDKITLRVKFDEAVAVDTTNGTPYLPLTLNVGGTVNASYISGSGSDELVFQYTVKDGEFDTDGITVNSAILANGGSLTDSVGNNATLTLNNVGNTSKVLVVTTVVSDKTVSDIVIVGNLLTFKLDSIYYDYIQILANGTQYGDTITDITSKNISVNLPTESGAYSILIRVYDLLGNSKDFAAVYNVRVKYVPGKGDGFGWEMWKY